MRFDYFYEEQSESYSFYRIPKLLFTEEMFETLSTEAKVLYGLLLDVKRRIDSGGNSGMIPEALQNRQCRIGDDRRMPTV